MEIIFYDGGILTCSTIEFSMNGKNLIADGYRTVPLNEILKIIEEG